MAFGSSANLTFDILANDRASAKFNNLSRAAKGGVGPLGSFGGKLKSIAKAGALAAGAAVVVAAKFGIDAVEAASDLNEVVSKTQVMFGKSARSMSKWADGAATAFGQSKTQALDAASNFAIFGKSAGLSGDKLTGFSKKFVGLASDLASFNNTSPEEAIVAIGAAMRGESEPIRKYGVLLDDATLRQQALKMGLIETTTQALTPQQKVLAASAQIFKQTSVAQGDFSRTSEGLANQQRILAAQFTDVKASIGQQLLPVAVKLFTWANDMIPKVAQFGQALSSKLGPAFTAVGGWLKANLLPALQELGHTMGQQMPGFIATAKQAFKDAQPAFQIAGEVFRNVVGPALMWLGKHVIPMAANNLKILGKAFGAVGNVFRFIWNNMIQPVFKFMIQSISKALNALGILFQTLGKIPGAPAWIGKTGDALRKAADQANALANNIKKIPKRTEVVVHTSFTSSGRSGPGGTGGDLPGSSSGSSGGSGSTGNDTPRKRGGAAGRASSKSDLDGMVLRVVGLDPGMKAYLATGGSGRYS